MAVVQRMAATRWMPSGEWMLNTIMDATTLMPSGGWMLSKEWVLLDGCHLVNGC